MVMMLFGLAFIFFMALLLGVYATLDRECDRYASMTTACGGGNALRAGGARSSRLDVSHSDIVPTSGAPEILSPPFVPTQETYDANPEQCVAPGASLRDRHLVGLQKKSRRELQDLIHQLERGLRVLEEAEEEEPLGDDWVMPASCVTESMGYYESSVFWPVPAKGLLRRGTVRRPSPLRHSSAAHASAAHSATTTVLLMFSTPPPLLAPPQREECWGGERAWDGGRRARACC